MATAPLHSGQVDCLVSLVNTALFTTNVFLVPPVYLSRIDSICSILTIWLHRVRPPKPLPHNFRQPRFLMANTHVFVVKVIICLDIKLFFLIS